MDTGCSVQKIVWVSSAAFISWMTIGVGSGFNCSVVYLIFCAWKWCWLMCRLWSLHIDIKWQWGQVGNGLEGYLLMMGAIHFRYSGGRIQMWRSPGICVLTKKRPPINWLFIRRRPFLRGIHLCACCKPGWNCVYSRLLISCGEPGVFWIRFLYNISICRRLFVL